MFFFCVDRTQEKGLNIIMKKYLVLLFCLITIPAYAGVTVEVQALTPFDSTKPPATMRFRTLDNVSFENGVTFDLNTIVDASVIDVKFPKRGKRNASFTLRPTSYTANGVTKEISDFEFTAKYKAKREIDKGKMALSAATTVGGYFVHGLSQGVSLVKGMVKNEEGNRIKSGAVQVYEDSPLSYIEKGEELYIYENEIFYLRFKTSELDEDENIGEDSVENKE